MLAATIPIATVVTVVALIAITGWVADQTLMDLRKIRQDRQRRR